MGDIGAEEGVRREVVRPTVISIGSDDFIVVSGSGYSLLGDLASVLRDRWGLESEASFCVRISRVGSPASSTSSTERKIHRDPAPQAANVQSRPPKGRRRRRRRKKDS